MDTRIVTLEIFTLISTLGARSGYWQIEIDNKNNNKTFFTSLCGLYRLTGMPFGIRNAPGTFQRAMDIILSLVKSQPALVFREVIKMFPETTEEHISNMKQVLTLLRKVTLTIKLEKCRFLTNTIYYIENITRPQGYATAESNSNLKTWEVSFPHQHNVLPRKHNSTAKARDFFSYHWNYKVIKGTRNVKDLPSVSKHCNIFRPFVCCSVRIAAPLNLSVWKNQTK